MMSKDSALALVLVFLTFSCVKVAKPVSAASAAGNSWVEKAPMHVARANLGVAVVNGGIYAIGGNTITGEYNLDQGFYRGITGGTVNTTEQYDTATDTWTFKTPMPTPRDSFAIAVYQGEIYCIGGRTSIPLYSPQTFTTVNEVFNPANDTWQTKSPLPSMQFPLQANVVNGNIYVICGSGTMYAYNPTTDSWSTKTSAPYVKSYPNFVSAVFDDKIYVIGLSSLNIIYDPLNDTWSVAHSSQPYSIEGLMGYGDFVAAAGATTGILASKRIYVFYDNQTYVYDNAADSWASGASMPNERVSYGLAVINDTFYIIGGGTYGEGFFALYAPSGRNEQYIPIGYGTPDPSYVVAHTPPQISVKSPLNQTYNDSSVPIVFTINKNASWISYSLDGQQNITITGNSSLANLNDGLHNLTVYANDTFGNMGSQTVTFAVAMREPFPTLIVAAVSGAIVVVVVTAGLLVYFKKRRFNFRKKP